MSHVWLKDLEKDSTERISRGRNGDDGNGPSTDPSISADGRFVVFASQADNLVAHDTNRASDVFVRDRWLSTTLLASMNRRGTGPGNGPSTKPVMAANGRTVVFQSLASDLVSGDYNDKRDVFVLHLAGEDTDADGLDDEWELAFFETLARDGTGDHDQDGATDAAEFRAGTDPTNQGSVLRVLTVTSPGSEGTTVLWSAVPGRTYQVQFKDAVDKPEWTNLPGPVTPASSSGAAADPAGGQSVQRFYRVVVVP